MTDAERERTEALYQQHLETINRTARYFAKKYRLPYEDAIADAGYHFLEAVAKHDPEKTTLESRILTVLRSRFTDAARSTTGVRSGRGAVPRSVPVTQIGRRCQRYDKRDTLLVKAEAHPDAPAWTFGDDARMVVDLLVTTRIKDIFRLRLAVYRYLRDGAGWAPKRFKKAWAEVVSYMPESAQPGLIAGN